MGSYTSRSGPWKHIIDLESVNNGEQGRKW